MKEKTRKCGKDVRDLPLKVKAEMALKEAVAEALAEHKRQGNPIAVWRNGKAVWIPPEEIVVPEETNRINRRRIHISQGNKR